MDPLPWKITLVCGASGAGKTRLALPLSRRYGLPLTEVDDIVTAVTALTTPRQAPALHFWNTHPEAAAWPPDALADLHFTVAEALRPGLRAVIEDHLAFDAPVVLEGDYVLPELAAGYDGAVRAVVVQEADPAQLVANFAAREPGPDQHVRAASGVVIGAELARRAGAAGQAVVAARPWADLVERADRALRGR
ncbi:AAA family ATPase [Streptomyces sp. NPDC059917]|uniref:AAA family ATPase n=1 Tax=Streptomyces sp. NPDC059917 TaxID=3347002 RepID=UPI003669CDB3